MTTTTYYRNQAGLILAITAFTASGNIRSGDARKNFRIDGKKVSKAVGAEFIKTAQQITADEI